MVQPALPRNCLLVPAEFLRADAIVVGLDSEPVDAAPPQRAGVHVIADPVKDRFATKWPVSIGQSQCIGITVTTL